MNGLLPDVRELPYSTNQIKSDLATQAKAVSCSRDFINQWKAKTNF